MSDNLNNLFATIKRQLTADKKKSIALGALSLVFVVVFGRLFVGDSDPRQAVASPIPTPASHKGPVPQMAKQGISSPVSTADGSSKFSSRREGIEGVGLQKRISVEDVQMGLTRDLFTTSSWHLFEAALSAGSSNSEDSGDNSGAGFFTRLARRLAENEKARSETMQQLRKELEQLELQSTMTGDRRLAYISGRMLHEGDRISGFSVVRIGDQHVILRKLGITQTLNMP